MMQTDVKGKTCGAGASTTAFNGRTRFKGIALSSDTADETVDIKDGSTTLFTFTTTAVGPMNVIVPGEGVVCSTSLVVTCSANVTAVVFYG
jgi:hypothetical protein